MASTYFGTTLAHTADNVHLVYEAMYATGRLPVDQYDWAYFQHDIGSIASDGLHQVLNDIQMGVNVFTHLVNNDPALDGYGYPIASIPFIEIAASAVQEGVAVFQAGVNVITSVSNALATVGGGVASSLGQLFVGNLGPALSAFGDAIGSAATELFNSLKDAIEHIFPVVLDFGDKGYNLTSLDTSAAFLQMDGNVSDHVAWIGEGSALLAFDKNGNGVVDGAGEISLSLLKPGARSDLEGLSALDSNHDGVVSTADNDFSRLLVWFDKNANGVSDPGEALTASQAGLGSISLDLTWNSHVYKGNFIDNTSSFTTMDGMQHAAYDVQLTKEFTGSIIGT